MFVRLPDPHPGRCINTRIDRHDPAKTLRCLGNEGHRDSCYFEKTFPPVQAVPASNTYTYREIKPQPWVAPPRPTDDPDVVGNCSACGLELRRVMGYCCPQMGCPSGMGPIVS